MTTSLRLLAVVAFSGVACTAVTAQVRPEYGIKEDAPRTGSLLRKNEVKGSPIPVNVSYEQLSVEDKASFHQYYESLKAGDEPPFPIGGLKAIYDPLRKGQAVLLVRGEIFLAAKVDPTGKVTEVSSLQSPDAEMTKFAARILYVTKFKPAICSGLPCVMEFPLRMTFTVER